MENLSTEQLKEILRKDALSETDSDLDMIIRISEIVAEREPKVDVQAKWEEFEKRYMKKVGKMTRADVIRNMSDEELADWITETAIKGPEWFERLMCEQCKQEYGAVCPSPEEWPCHKSERFMLDWLREEQSL